MTTTFRSTVAVLLLTGLVACEDDPVAPTTGSLEVTVTTDGEGTDPDGYTLVLDTDGDSEDVDVDDMATFEDLEAGGHTVELTGLATNCTVDGDNPRTVEVIAADATEATFEVTCAAS